MVIFEGLQFRIRIEEGKPGGNCSSGLLMILESEDDDNWFEVSSFDGAWLNDLERIVQQANEYFQSKKEK